jgi:hypothetical protein
MSIWVAGKGLEIYRCVPNVRHLCKSLQIFCRFAPF